MSGSRSSSPITDCCSQDVNMRSSQGNRNTLHNALICKSNSGEESHFIIDNDENGAFVFCSNCDFKIHSCDEFYDCLRCEKSFTPPKQIVIRTPNSFRKYTNQYCAICYQIMKEERAKKHEALMTAQMDHKKQTNVHDKMMQENYGKILLQKYEEKRKALFNARYPPISAYII